MRSLPRLWLCADVTAPAPQALRDRVGAALAAGAAVVWVRSPPGCSVRSLLQIADDLRRLTTRQGSLLLVGDRLDVALAVGADGVHLAERSVLPADARRLAPPGFIVSRAAHDEEGARCAASADAMILSPFGRVAGKGPPLGAAGFERLRRLAPATFAVALGGIVGASAARAAVLAGANAVAVRRVLDSDDPFARCAALHAALS